MDQISDLAEILETVHDPDLNNTSAAFSTLIMDVRSIIEQQDTYLADVEKLLEAQA